MVGQVLKRGEAPRGFHAESARVRAAQGKREAALVALERAVAMGWQSYTSVAPRLAEEPAFRNIRDEPRLEQIDARIQGDLARERREFGQVAS